MSHNEDIPLPNESGRRQLFNINLKHVPLNENIDWEYMVKETDSYSGADISNVCREAAYMPLKKMLNENHDLQIVTQKRAEIERPISMEDLTMAIQNIKKSVTNEHLHRYSKWMEEFGSK